MLVTTQWPLKRAAHLTSLLWVCVLWLPWKLNGAICAMSRQFQFTNHILIQKNSIGFPWNLRTSLSNIFSWTWIALLRSLSRVVKQLGSTVICFVKSILAGNSSALSFFFNLNDISPGSSHPSIQCDVRSLTGDLPTTAPLTTDLWILKTLSSCIRLPMVILPIKC